MVGLLRRSALGCIALILCALANSGCTSCLPTIDPTGEHVLLWPNHEPLLDHHHHAPHVYQVPGEITHHHQIGVTVTPGKIVAPVGSEVVVLAGVCGCDGFLRAGERVEWSLSPGGVGQIVQVGERSKLDLIHELHGSTGKVDNTFALGRTSWHYLNLNRGTPITEDDVPVQKGQAWMSVTSPVEGTTFVTAYAPAVYGWDNHKQTSTVHWIDAQWTFPPAATNPMGSRHTFTTTVSRHTSQVPVTGWRVRYEISGGPPAGFAPDGAQSVEVLTNEMGQASAEIMQAQPSPGTNTINIQLIRPPLSTGGDPFVIATGSTSKTWTAPNLEVALTGPAQGRMSDTLTYRIVMRNTSGSNARDVRISLPATAGLTLVSATPQPATAGTEFVWQLGDVPGGEARAIDVNLRAERQGSINLCATARSAEGLAAQNCVTTTITTSAVGVVVAGPPTAAIGQDVTFEAAVTNYSTTPLTKLIIVDRYDAGLVHASGRSPIESQLPDLAPGQTTRVNVALRVSAPGTLCNVFEVQSETGAVLGSGRACITAGAGGAAGPVAPPTNRPPVTQPNQPRRPIAIHKTGPSQSKVGENAKFIIEITNPGTAPLTDLKLVDNYDPSFQAKKATDGHRVVGSDLVWSVDTLPAGKTIRFEVECLCVTPTARACNRATVISAEGARGDDEACVQITPGATGTLAVKVNDRTDPLAVGGDSYYDIVVTNQSQAEDRNITIDATIPQQMAPLAAGTTGPTQASVNGQTVRFEQLPRLAPGQSAAYHIHVRPQRPGSAVFRATVRSANTPAGTTVEETTLVFAENR